MGRREDKCAYCGKEMKKRTKDHIISRGFFPSALPSSFELITCRCCLECQEDKNSCEEYVITSVRLDEQSENYLGGEELRDKAIRALQRGNRGLIHKVNQSLIWEWNSVEGILQYSPVGIRPLEEELRKFLEYLTKGMYYHLTSDILPCQMRVEMFIPLVPRRIPYPLNTNEVKLISLVTECIDNCDYSQMVGEGDFMCAMKTFFDENNDKSVSVFVFVIRGHVSITTVVPNE